MSNLNFIDPWSSMFISELTIFIYWFIHKIWILQLSGHLKLGQDQTQNKELRQGDNTRIFCHLKLPVSYKHKLQRFLNTREQKMSSTSRYCILKILAVSHSSVIDLYKSTSTFIFICKFLIQTFLSLSRRLLSPPYVKRNKLGQVGKSVKPKKVR